MKMSTPVPAGTEFPKLNVAYNSVFKTDQLSIGLVVPIERYVDGPIPSMRDHIKRAQLAEELGFAAVWLRDVPFNVPSFGDAGQLFDPFVYLGMLAGMTESIGLGVASIVLPLRHPAHVAKAAASADTLSGGRLLLGIASGDRPEEYPAMNMSYDDRGAVFRESYHYIRKSAESYPHFENHYGSQNGTIDLLPKPSAGRLPLLVTGSSRQSPDWLASHGDGCMTFPRQPEAQKLFIDDWRARCAEFGTGLKPVMQPLYIDLLGSENAGPQPIHLGFRCGVNFLLSFLRRLRQIGVNHVALNLRFNRAATESTLTTLANKLTPEFMN